MGSTSNSPTWPPSWRACGSGSAAQRGMRPPATCRLGCRKVVDSSRLQRASRRWSSRPSLPRFSMSTRGAAPGRGMSSTRQRSRRCWSSRSTWVAGRSEERPAAMASGTEDRPSRRPRARAGPEPPPRVPWRGEAADGGQLAQPWREGRSLGRAAGTRPLRNPRAGGSPQASCRSRCATSR